MRVAALAFALIAAPLVAGFGIGRGVRRLARGRVIPRLVEAGAALVLAALVASGAIASRVGAWDGIELGLLAGVGLVLGVRGAASRAKGPELILASVTTVLMLGFAELASRLVLPPPPHLPPASSARVMIPRLDATRLAYVDPSFPPGDTLAACSLAFPAVAPARFAERRGADDGRPVVLHLGDSMTYGLYVERAQAFPALLEKLDPRLAHVNAATPATSADFHFVVAQQWLDRVRARQIVVHLFANDLMEIDQAMPCCADGPLLAYDGPGVVERCPSPRFADGFGDSFAWLVHNSAAPYPLRAATAVSRFAAHVDVAFMAKVSSVSFARAPDEEKWSHVEQAVRGIRDEAARRRIPLVCVVLPVRQALQAKAPSQHPGYAISARLRSTCEQLGIRTLDPWDEFEQRVRVEGAAPFFVPPDDIHFTARGHQVMAGWLLPRLASDWN